MPGHLNKYTYEKTVEVDAIQIHPSAVTAQLYAAIPSLQLLGKIDFHSDDRRPSPTQYPFFTVRNKYENPQPGALYDFVVIEDGKYRVVKEADFAKTFKATGQSTDFDSNDHHIVPTEMNVYRIPAQSHSVVEYDDGQSIKVFHGPVKLATTKLADNMSVLTDGENHYAVSVKDNYIARLTPARVRPDFTYLGNSRAG